MNTATPTEASIDFDRDNLVFLIPRMRSFARFLCRDMTEAEDLTQAAFERAWRRRDSYLPGTNMKAWVLTIVRNQFYSDKRRSWRVSQLDPRIAEETLEAISDPIAAVELDDVRRAMLELSDEQRQALNLITVVGLPYQEVADICRCAVGTIKSRVNRARQTLTEILAIGDLTAEARTPSMAMAAIWADAELSRRPRQPQSRRIDAQGDYRLAA